MKFNKGSGIVISNKYKDSEFYVRIRADLTRRSKQYNTSDYIVQKFYLESDNGDLLIPRFFPVQNFINEKVTIDDLSQKGEKIKINHQIVPRNEIQNQAINYMLTNESGIMELQPGVGKTVISIFVIATRKRKSFILVHRDALVDQWKKRFLQFTDLKDEDISRLTSSSFEDDLSKSIIISTNQTFISLLKRNRRPFLNTLKNSNFGIFIADEVHTTVGAPSFSECSIHIPANVIFGLSATPYRWDGNSDVIKYHLGETFSSDDTSGTMEPKVTVILVDYQIDIPKRHTYLYWGGDFQRSRYLNLMKKSEVFMNVAKKLLEKIKIDKNVIFVAERIKLIDELYNWLDHDNKSRFTGSAKDDQLEYQITFSTPGKIRDGIDIKEKDCLVMTSPISNISQMCGRVIREKEGKQMPAIIDMVDIGCKRMSNTFYKRLDFYHEKEWKVNFYMIDCNWNMVEVVEEIAIQIIKGD